MNCGVVKLLGFLLLLAVVGMPAAFRQHYLPGYVRQIAPNLYVAAIPTTKIEAYAAPKTRGRHHKENWCWAATIQMALNLSGLDVTQEMIVERVFGGDLDQPADTGDYLKALSSWPIQFNGHSVTIRSWVGVSSLGDYIQDLSLGWPVIVGLNNGNGGGHAYMMTGVRYTLDKNGLPVFQSVILRDPWPSNQSRIEMPWSEYASKVHRIIRFRVQWM